MRIPALPRPRRTTRPRPSVAAAVSAALLAGLLGGCSSPRAAQESAEASTAQVPVSAAFYPLAYLLEQVGGPGVHVSTITKPGVEPHDLELTPKDLVDLPKMSLVVYLKGFQPAIDAAVAQQAPTTAYDVSTAADLTLNAPEGESGTTATDPHFWLDPIRYAAVATAVGERLALADPPHAADYRARAATFAASMAELDKRSIMSPEVAAILGVDAPAEAAPSQAGGVPEGIDPADWQAMTPEERALWSN